MPELPANDWEKTLAGFLRPWHTALQDPPAAQNIVLQKLVQIYTQTQYGAQHKASEVESLATYRTHFPVMTYDQYEPLLQRVIAGESSLLLNESAIGWAITRGTTRGKTKFIPMTPTDLRQRVSAGRAVMNYVATSRRYDTFKGVNLNLNFPSVVGRIKTGNAEVEYGYSSGIYTRHVSTQTPVHSVPSQEEIDALGGGKTVRDWERRFDLAFDLCREKNVTLVGGVAPTALEFGRYMWRKHHRLPKQLWNICIMTLGSVPGINTRLAPALQAMYGKAAIREIYGATEGMFGQQMDEKRAWVPNYDLYLLEVETPSGIKMLHELKPGQRGSLVVSTPVLPRYRMGDTIQAIDPPYFRCIGRDHWTTPLRYLFDEFVDLNFGRL